MNLNFNSYTPEKSQVITTVKGNRFTQKIKLINKKGVFKYRKQCDDCKFTGKVQDGLGFCFSRTCDRDKGFWKSMSGTTEKPCEYFSSKE